MGEWPLGQQDLQEMRRYRWINFKANEKREPQVAGLFSMKSVYEK